MCISIVIVGLFSCFLLWVAGFGTEFLNPFAFFTMVLDEADLDNRKVTNCRSIVANRKKKVMEF